MKNFLFTLLFFIIPFHFVQSQWIEDEAIDKLIRQGIKSTYDVNFDAAEKSFRSVIQSRPDHPAGHFFLAMVVLAPIAVILVLVDIYSRLSSSQRKYFFGLSFVLGTMLFLFFTFKLRFIIYYVFEKAI